MTLLFGRGARSAQAYADRHHFDRSKYKIIHDEHDLYGYIHGTLLILVGDWTQATNGYKVMDRALQHGLAVVSEVK